MDESKQKNEKTFVIVFIRLERRAIYFYHSRTAPNCQTAQSGAWIWRNSKFIRPVDCSKMARSFTVWPIREKGKAAVTSFSSKKMVKMNAELCSTSYLPGTMGLLLFRSLKRKEASVHQSWKNRMIQWLNHSLRRTFLESTFRL